MKDIPTRWQNLPAPSCCDDDIPKSPEIFSSRLTMKLEDTEFPLSPIELPAPQMEFNLFDLLPKELRCTIWELALEELRPRTIRIAAIVPNGYILQPQTVSKAKAYNTPVPSLLITSSEARSIAKKAYKLILSQQLAGRPIYFDFLRDSLYIDSMESLKSLYLIPFVSPSGTTGSSNAMAPVESELRTLMLGFRLSAAVIETLSNFKSLKTLVCKRTQIWTTQISGERVALNMSSWDLRMMARFSNGLKAKALGRGETRFLAPKIECLDSSDIDRKCATY